MEEYTRTKIKRVTPVGETKEWVYDLTMAHPTDQWFFANNILVHNSTYFSALYNRDTSSMSFVEQEAEAVRVADDVAKHVNDRFPDFMADAFLCQPDFMSMVKAAREVVAPRGIFVTPKRYVLWVTNMDGKPVDKLKVMGLDTKKTILPRYIQKKLNSYIERFLKGEDWSSVAQDVVAYKEYLRTEQNLIELGLPKGINKLELYTAEYLSGGDKVRLPGHVAAAILFNKMLDENEDTQTMRITSEMKIKVFYLRRPIGRFKSIAFPVDEERVPQWFLDQNFDVDKQIEKLVDNPLKNLLKAINLSPPSKQSLFVESILEF